MSAAGPMAAGTNKSAQMRDRVVAPAHLDTARKLKDLDEYKGRSREGSSVTAG